MQYLNCLPISKYNNNLNKLIVSVLSSFMSILISLVLIIQAIQAT